MGWNTCNSFVEFKLVMGVQVNSLEFTVFIYKIVATVIIGDCLVRIGSSVTVLFGSFFVSNLSDRTQEPSAIRC